VLLVADWQSRHSDAQPPKTVYTRHYCNKKVKKLSEICLLQMHLPNDGTKIHATAPLKMLLISRSFEITPLSKAWIPAVGLFHIVRVSCLTYSTSNNNLPLKSELRVTQGRWKWHHLIVRVWVFVFHGNHGHILYRFRDKSELLVKNSNISYLTCIRRPVLCKVYLHDQLTAAAPLVAVYGQTTRSIIRGRNPYR